VVLPFGIGWTHSDAVAPELDYHVLLKILNGTQEDLTGRRWDTSAKSPWFAYLDDKNQVHQLWYDDAESLTLKCRLAKSLGLRGVGMWEADALDYSNRSQVGEIWGTFRTFLD